ncbi:MAG: ASKHA domain-containing protein [Candidatus Heimdallarchaeota archaeon]
MKSDQFSGNKSRPLLYECTQQCHHCGRCFIDQRTILTHSTLLLDFQRFPAEDGLGVAVDLGTTTIVAYLWDFTTKQVKQVASKINSQRRYGIDVIKRQDCALTGNQKKLHDLVIRDINELILKLTNRPEDIIIVTLVGNTTMRDFFFDIPPIWATNPPYNADYKDPIKANATDVNLITRDAEIYSPPVVHGYWGGDALVGTYVLGLDSDPYVLFLDLGTNGEIAISYPSPMSSGNTILATSVSSAPCFEGMQILCGMGARPGAIAHITLDNDLSPTYEVISDDPGLEQVPRGLCGSGVIDLVAELLFHQVITPSGLFPPQFDHPRIIHTKYGKSFQLHTAPDLVLTQKDIGEVLMAKASFAAAIQTILDEMLPSHHMLHKIYLAGAFGLHCRPENAVRVGMIPSCNKVESVGNTAGLGAIYYLYKNEREKIDKLVKGIKYIPLTGNEHFNNYFLAENTFPTHISVSNSRLL